MQINVRIHRVFDSAGALKAVATVAFDEQFVVHGVKVVETSKGRFVAMPNEIHKDKDGKETRRDTFHPISSSASKALEEAVITAYEQFINNQASIAN